MHTEDVIFTKRKFEGFDSLNNFFGDDKTALDDYIYQIKNKIFIDTSRWVSSSGIYLLKLIVDFFQSKRDGNYNIILGLGQGMGGKYSKDENFLVFMVDVHRRILPIENNIFDFNDIDIDFIHNSLEKEGYKSINSDFFWHSAAMRYLEDLAKPMPIMDKLDREERDIFKGVF